MLKHMHPNLVQRCLAEAARSPRSNPRVDYPRWYLQRWHFLPEGYLSRRSAAGYEAIIRQLYNLTRESAVLSSLLGLMRAQKHEDVLELGCGPGRALHTLAAGLPTAYLTGLDLSPFMLERAEQRIHGAPRIELVHGDGGALPWAAPAFDAVVAIHYFGHLPESARGAAIIEARRALSPDGRLYVVEHAWHSTVGNLFEPESESSALFGKLKLTSYRPAPLPTSSTGLSRESCALAV
ncbi:MAG: class I SAM-dependent methyltransferase [Tepidiformaceae bacterium]